MTTIYFVRHAEPNYDNHDDMTRELSEKGLKDRSLVTELQGFEIEIVEDFRERRIDNCWIEDFQGFCKKQWEDFSYKLSDGESLHEVQTRNIAALKGVLNRYEGKNLVVGSHGTALSTIINYYDSSFGYAQFEEIRGLMPWVVQFCFEGEECVTMRKYNVFEG